MKNVFLILTILFSANSFAKDGGIDPTWKLLGNMSKGTLSSECPTVLSDFKIAFHRAKLTYNDTAYRNNLLTEDTSVDFLETKCSEIIYKITIPQRSKYMQDINMEVYCKPRSFSDSTLVSLFKKCQISPQQECFDKQLIARLDQVKETSYRYDVINGGYCR